MDKFKDALASIVAGLCVILLDGLFLFWAWNSFAWEFNLPIFSYWHWVATLMAFRALFSHIKIKGK